MSVVLCAVVSSSTDADVPACNASTSLADFVDSVSRSFILSVIFQAKFQNFLGRSLEDFFS